MRCSHLRWPTPRVRFARRFRQDSLLGLSDVAPRAPGTAKNGIQIKFPGSTEAFTLPQILDRFNVADWYRGEHPKIFIHKAL